MLQEIDLFKNYNVGLKKTNRLLPSYSQLIGKTIGKLHVVQLCRKKNRNLLHCICECGREEYLYRWELKNKRSCSFCNVNTKENCVSEEYFASIKKQKKGFYIEVNVTYDYVNELLKRQNYRCVFSKSLLNASNDLEKRNAVLTLIDPQKGYVNGNVEWVIDSVAHMKGSMSNHDFIKYCKKIIRYYKPLKKEQNIDLI